MRVVTAVATTMMACLYCSVRSLVHPTTVLVHHATHRMLSRSQQVRGSSSRRQYKRAFGSLQMAEGVPGQGIEAAPVAAASVADVARPRPLLRRCINEAPDEPGVYVMESASGRKLYIGKSIKLSSRVPTYFASSSSSSGINSNSNSNRDAGEPPSAPADVVLPGSNLSRRIEAMTTLVERVDYIVTASGAEALLLEASMIRQHQPPFNVLLKDDKQNYPYVCITWSEPYPRLIITKHKPRLGGGPEDRYYGPFVDRGQLKSTVALVRRLLPLRERQRPLYQNKPCLNYDIGLCPGACQGLISEDDYAVTVRLAEMVFMGKGDELLSRLRERMVAASDDEEFERAGEIKTQMALVHGGLLGSALHFSSGDDWNRKNETVAYSDGCRKDVVAVGLARDLACFQVFQMRGGRLTGRLGFTYRVAEGLSRAEVLQACLERYWGDALEPKARREKGADRHSPSSLSVGGTGSAYAVDVPDEIVTADALPEGGADLLAELLSGVREVAAKDTERETDGDQPKTSKPQKRDADERRLPPVQVFHAEGSGERHHLCVMVSKNAEMEAKRLLKRGEATLEGLSQLARMLGLASPPARIEGYDVSHTGGGQAVAGAVCFVGGKVSPKNHRRYRIKSPLVRKGHSDDYASLREVIARRFAPPSPSLQRPSRLDPVPDLVLIDGGKGQLAAALEGASAAAEAWEALARGGEARDHDDGRADGTRPPSDTVGILPVKSVAVDGVTLGVASDAAALSTSSTPPLSEPGVLEREDPDGILLTAASSSEPFNGRASLGCNVDVGGGRRVAFLSLAKKEEEVFVPGASEPLPFAVQAGPKSPGVILLRQVRDEAHRFALAYHQKLRGKGVFLPAAATGMAEERGSGNARGDFEGIAGLSSKSKKALMEAFGSIEGARVAGEAELRTIPGVGPTLAKRILA